MDNILRKFKGDINTVLIIASMMVTGGFSTQPVRRFVTEQRGQLTLNRLLGLVILVLVFSALLPTIQEEVNKINESIGASSATSTIVQLIPLFLAIAMLVSILRSTQVQ